jgi:hypothetical protein
MPSRSSRFVVLFIAGLLAALMASSSFAQSGSIEVSQASFYACSGTNLEGRWALAVYDASGNLINGSSTVNVMLYAAFSNGATASNSWNYQAGQAVDFIFGTSGTFAYVDIYPLYNGVQGPVYRYGCDGSISVLGGGNIGPDGRINRENGDLISALYNVVDKNGKPVIRVYDIDANSKGILRGDYAYSLFAPYIDNPPASNTIVARLGRTVLIALNTGEFQINVGPDAEGKIHEITFSSLPAKNIKFNSYIAR